MSAFSIRKLPKPLEKAISQEAKKQQKTKTAVVLQILQSAFHLDPKEDRKKKLRKFFGRMTQKEFEHFQEVTDPFSKIEKDLWK